MEPSDPNRFRNRKPTFSPTERFLGVLSHAPALENTSSSAEELDEDDVVFFSDDYTEPNHPSSTASSSSSSTPNHHHKCFGFGPSDSFGILAALPENARNGSHFFHKASGSVSVSVSLSSSSSSSSSRLIPAIPKPPPLMDRTPSSSLVNYHQSAPVNVPILSPAMMKNVRGRNFDDASEDEEEMVPPHEMVARNSARSPMLSCSVLEGMGRTLKGRDLRRVRNAVMRQTGFLD